METGLEVRRKIYEGGEKSGWLSMTVAEKMRRKDK